MSSPVPPHNLDAERAVLGAILLEGRETVPRVIEVLKPSDFFTEAHRLTYQGMLALFDRGEPVDILTLTEELRQSAQLQLAGGPAALALLLEQGAIAVHLGSYIAIVRGRAALRELIQSCRQTLSQAYEDSGNPEQLVEGLLTQIIELNVGSGAGIVTPAQFAHELESMPIVELVRTGIPILDDNEAVVSGYVAVIAARPGLGKTALSVQVIRQVAIKSGLPTLMVSIEMSRRQIGVRLLNQLSGRSIAHIGSRRCEPRALNGALEQIKASGLYIQDERVASVSNVVAAIRRGVMQYGVKLVIVDHVHLLDGSGRERSRQEEIAAISRALRAVAKDLKLPIIALARLNGAIEARPDPRPRLSDLRDSGGLEQDAGSVAVIWNPARHDDDLPDPLEWMEPKLRPVRISLLKNRDGGLDEREYLFDGPKGTFVEQSDREPDGVELI